VAWRRARGADRPALKPLRATVCGQAVVGDGA
jgi:hypothetical protein